MALGEACPRRTCQLQETSGSDLPWARQHRVRSIRRKGVVKLGQVRDSKGFKKGKERRASESQRASRDFTSVQFCSQPSQTTMAVLLFVPRQCVSASHFTDPTYHMFRINKHRRTVCAGWLSGVTYARCSLFTLKSLQSSRLKDHHANLVVSCSIRSFFTRPGSNPAETQAAFNSGTLNLFNWRQVTSHTPKSQS